MKRIMIVVLLLYRLDAQTFYSLHLATDSDPLMLAASALVLDESQRSRLFLIRYTPALYELHAIVDQNKTRVWEWLPSYLPFYLSTIVEPVDSRTLETHFCDISPFLKKAIERQNLKQVSQVVSIPFEFASDRLGESAVKKLQPIKKTLKQLRSGHHLTLFIAASADSVHVGDENDSNMALSLRRAQAISGFLSAPEKENK